MEGRKHIKGGRHFRPFKEGDRVYVVGKGNGYVSVVHDNHWATIKFPQGEKRIGFSGKSANMEWEVVSLSHLVRGWKNEHR